MAMIMMKTISKLKNNVPFIFDAHFGGNWGTAYRGYQNSGASCKDNSLLTYVS